MEFKSSLHTKFKLMPESQENQNCLWSSGVRLGTVRRSNGGGNRLWPFLDPMTSLFDSPHSGAGFTAGSTPGREVANLRPKYDFASDDESRLLGQTAPGCSWGRNLEPSRGGGRIGKC